MNKTLLIALGALAAVAVATLVALHYQEQLIAGLPPRDVFRTSLAEASAAAESYAREHGGSVIPVAGTGSEQPYIPAAAPGADRMAVVAYAVTSPTATFADVQTGELVIYRPEWNEGRPVLHQAAAFNGGGWIMTGLHNRSYENSERMTPGKFVGRVVYVAVYAP